MIILYLSWKIVWNFTYKWIECNNNQILFGCIDQLIIKTVHDITETSKNQNWVLIFRLWYFYYWSTINRTHIVLLSRPNECYLNHSMMIQKSKLCLAQIKSFVDCWGWYLAGELENGSQATAEHMGRIFEVS